MEQLYIRTFGAFSISVGEKTVSDVGKRAAMPWVLLAYLICNRGTVISQKKLIEVLWGDSTENRSPENTLRITLHRARGLLDGLWLGAGRELIVHKDDGYCWNEETETVSDYEEFERLCLSTYEEKEDRLHALQRALLLYGGAFLEKQSAEPWVIPISAYYHNLYISAVMETAEILGEQGFHLEAARVCQEAIPHEAFNEELHGLLMRELLAAGDRSRAVTTYETLSRRLYDEFGIHPGESVREQYRICRLSVDELTLSAEDVLNSIQETEYSRGALECDYDCFKVLCQSERRGMERNGSAAHICLLTVIGASGKPMTKRTAERVMGQLSEEIRLNLRRGDTYSRCSSMQFVIMLPKANYENSSMVCRRIIGAFVHSHPGMNVKIQYTVQPLLPAQPND